MVIDPIKICCGRKQSEHSGALCPTGTFMCSLCFERLLPHQAATDEYGEKVSICLNCEAHDKFMLEVCEWVDAVKKAVDPEPKPTKG